ncbi:unnamed protein product, partial [Oppiella nova]
MSQPARTHEEIESQIRDIQAKKASLNTENGNDLDGRVSMSLSKAAMDSDIYGDNHNKYANYNTSIATNDDNDYE